MIARTHRFHGRGSLRRVYEHGKIVRSTSLGLRFLLNDRRKTFRVAIVVSKTISKSAVVRNRIRRRIYEVVRLKSSNIVLPYDLVVTVYKPGSETMSSTELEATIHHLFEQANIITKQPAKDEINTHAIIDAKET